MQEKKMGLFTFPPFTSLAVFIPDFRPRRKKLLSHLPLIIIISHIFIISFFDWHQWWLSAFSHLMLNVSKLFHDILRQHCAVLNHTYEKNLFPLYPREVSLAKLETTTSCPCSFGMHPTLLSYKVPWKTVKFLFLPSLCSLTKSRPLSVPPLILRFPVVLPHTLFCSLMSFLNKEDESWHRISPKPLQMPGKRK